MKLINYIIKFIYNFIFICNNTNIYSRAKINTNEIGNTFNKNGSDNKKNNNNKNCNNIFLNENEEKNLLCSELSLSNNNNNNNKIYYSTVININNNNEYIFIITNIIEFIQIFYFLFFIKQSSYNIYLNNIYIYSNIHNLVIYSNPLNLILYPLGSDFLKSSLTINKIYLFILITIFLIYISIFIFVDNKCLNKFFHRLNNLNINVNFYDEINTIDKSSTDNNLEKKSSLFKFKKLNLFNYCLINFNLNVILNSNILRAILTLFYKYLFSIISLPIFLSSFKVFLNYYYIKNINNGLSSNFDLINNNNHNHINNINVMNTISSNNVHYNISGFIISITILCLVLILIFPWFIIYDFNPIRYFVKPLLTNKRLVIIFLLKILISLFYNLELKINDDSIYNNTLLIIKLLIINILLVCLIAIKYFKFISVNNLIFKTELIINGLLFGCGISSTIAVIINIKYNITIILLKTFFIVVLCIVYYFIIINRINKLLFIPAFKNYEYKKSVFINSIKNFSFKNNIILEEKQTNNISQRNDENYNNLSYYYAYQKLQLIIMYYREYIYNKKVNQKLFTILFEELNNNFIHKSFNDINENNNNTYINKECKCTRMMVLILKVHHAIINDSGELNSKSFETEINKILLNNNNISNGSNLFSYDVKNIINDNPSKKHTNIDKYSEQDMANKDLKYLKKLINYKESDKEISSKKDKDKVIESFVNDNSNIPLKESLKEHSYLNDINKLKITNQKLNKVIETENLQKHPSLTKENKYNNANCNYNKEILNIINNEILNSEVNLTPFDKSISVIMPKKLLNTNKFENYNRYVKNILNIAVLSVIKCITKSYSILYSNKSYLNLLYCDLEMLSSKNYQKSLFEVYKVIYLNKVSRNIINNNNNEIKFNNKIKKSTDLNFNQMFHAYRLKCEYEKEIEENLNVTKYLAYDSKNLLKYHEMINIIYNKISESSLYLNKIYDIIQNKQEKHYFKLLDLSNDIDNNSQQIIYLFYDLVVYKNCNNLELLCIIQAYSNYILSNNINYKYKKGSFIEILINLKNIIGLRIKDKVNLKINTALLNKKNSNIKNFINESDNTIIDDKNTSTKSILPIKDSSKSSNMKNFTQGMDINELNNEFNINYDNIINNKLFLDFDNIGYVVIRNDVDDVGKIINSNNALLNILEYEDKMEFKNLNINSIIMNYFYSFHNIFILNYVKTNKANLVNKYRILPLTNKFGYQVFCHLYLKLYPDLSNGIKIIVAVKKLSSFEDSLLATNNLIYYNDLNFNSYISSLKINNQINISKLSVKDNNILFVSNNETENNVDNYNKHEAKDLSKNLTIKNSLKLVELELNFLSLQKKLNSLNSFTPLSNIGFIVTTTCPEFFVIGINSIISNEFGIPLSCVYNKNSTTKTIKLTDLLDSVTSDILVNNLNLINISNIYDLKSSEGIITILDTSKLNLLYRDFIEAKHADNNTDFKRVKNYNHKNKHVKHIIHLSYYSFYYSNSKSNINIFRVVKLLNNCVKYNQNKLYILEDDQLKKSSTAEYLQQNKNNKFSIDKHNLSNSNSKSDNNFNTNNTNCSSFNNLKITNCKNIEVSTVKNSLYSCDILKKSKSDINKKHCQKNNNQFEKVVLKSSFIKKKHSYKNCISSNNNSRKKSLNFIKDNSNKQKSAFNNLKNNNSKLNKGKISYYIYVLYNL